MPKAAGPSACARSSSATATASPIDVDAALTADFSPRRRSPSNSISAAVASGSSTGTATRWSGAALTGFRSRALLLPVDVVAAGQAAQREQHDEKERGRRKADHDGRQ